MADYTTNQQKLALVRQRFLKLVNDINKAINWKESSIDNKKNSIDLKVFFFSQVENNGP